MAGAIKAFENNDLIKCRADLAAAKKINGDLPQVDVILSRLHLLRRNYGPALALLESVVIGSESDPDLYHCFGEIALATGRYTDAWLHFNQAQTVAKTA